MSDLATDLAIVLGEPVLKDHPTCVLCTWVWLHGQFWLKYTSRMCPDHGRVK